MGRFEAPSEKKDEAEEPEEGKQREVSFQMAAFDQDQMGEVQYGNAGQWLESVISQLRPEGIPAEDGDSGFSSAFGDSANDAPVGEATSETWDTLCPKSNRICIVALVDGSDMSQVNVEAATETLELVKSKEKAMLAFSVVDATCLSEFSSGLGIDSARLPAVVALSRSRKKYTDHVGMFTDKSILTFVRQVKRGKKSLRQLPEGGDTLLEKDCKKVHDENAQAIAAAAALDDDGLDMDDMMADILAEEKREAEEREARAAEEEKKRREEEESKKKAQEEEAAKAAAKKRKKKRK